MRARLFTLIGMAMVAVGFSARAAETPSVVVTGRPGGPACASLSELSFQWYAASYLSPEKPMQIYVLGRNGHGIGGPEYRSLVTEIQKTAQACEKELSSDIRK